MYWCCLTCVVERSAIKIEGYARNDDAREALSKLRGASLFLCAAPVEPVEPVEPSEPSSLKAGMSGFEWLVTAYHFRASLFIKIGAKLCIKILANADPAIESAFP